MACDFRTFSVPQGSFLIPVLLIFSLFSGIYSQTSIPGNPNLAGDFEKNEGETVTLSCSSIGGNPLPSVQWYKNQQLVDPGSSSSGNGDGIYTVGSSTVTYNNYTFTVSRSDNLVSYICKVQNSLQPTPLERAWTISVYVPSEQPFISGPDPAITTALNSGATYKYVCTAQNGRPAPNLRWRLGTSLSTAIEFHQGITENTTTNADSTLSKSSSLSWVPITDDNGKNLYCQTDQTTAGGGTIQKSTSVPIVVQQIPILQIGSSSYTAQVGSSVTLACRVVRATPAITDLYWRKQVNGVYNRITIDNFKFVGGSIGNSNLTITNVALSDQTSYQCSATNSAGTGNSGATTLSVTGTLPTVQVGSSGYSGITGGTVTLACTIISSNPSATAVIWEKDVNGFPTNVSSLMASRISGGTVSQPSLTISSLIGGDTGTYYCSAANSVGTGSRSSTTLTVQSRPSIVLPAFTYNAQFSKDVTLVCNVTSATTLTNVVWRKYSNGVPNNLVVTGSSHYSGGTNFIPSLTILTLTFSDSGNYDCSATNVAGTTTSSQMTLNVIGTVPNVNIPQTRYSVTYGGTVTLVCVVNSNPFQNRVEWQRIANGVSTTLNVTAEPRYSGGSINTPSLTISVAVSGDAGVYVCSATNDAGKGVSGQTVLSVQGNVPSVSVSQTTYSIFVGSSVTMNCFVSGNPAVSLVFWTVTRNGFTQNAQDGRYSNGDANNPSLTITNARQSDTGIFICKAQNSAGTTDSSPISLTVSGTAPNVTMAQSSYSVFTNGEVTLSCFVSANPSATISWTFTSNSGSVTAITASTSKYSVATSTTASTLTVRSANSNDQGSYMCSATNSVGTGQATATLVVSGSLPSINLPSTYSVTTGNDITMTCTVSANPAVNSVFWQFKIASGFSFTNITASFKYSISSLTGTSSLTVRSTTSSDNGQYRCQATNQVGTSQSTTVLTVSGSVPTVNIPQNSYSSVTGQDVQIPCSVSANPTATISWTFISTSQSQTSITTSTTKYTFNPTSTDGQLRIRSTSSSDTGTYRCQATNAVGTSSDSASLSVSGSPPSVNFGSSSYTVTTGQSIQLVCFVSASPTATAITWTFQSNIGGGTTTITSSTSGYSLTTTTSYTQSTLTVLSAQSSNGGTYTCTATNIVDTRSASVSLSVSGNIPTVTIPQNSYSAITGQDVQIPCSVSASPSASISWIFVSTTQSQITISSSTFKYTFNPSATDGTLRIRSTTSSDTGTYRCQATNAVGTASDSATLSVTGSVPSVNFGSSSYTVTTGQRIQLVCFVSASPTATDITWTFQSNIGGGTTTITSSTSGYSLTTTTSYTQSTLTVLSAQSSNGGTYTCTATNAVGTRPASVSLSVSGNIPTVTIPQNSYSVITGQDVQIPCSVSASPSASISWIFISTSQSQITISSSTFKYTFNPSSTDGTLTVRSTTSSDTGTYRCQATNPVGTASDSATLSVSGSLPIVTITQTSYSVITGSNQQIPCFVSANPTASSIGWTFRSATSGTTVTITSSTSGYSIVTSSTSQSTLTVLAADNNDEGTYTCQATNQVGNGSDSTLLDVTGSMPVVTLPTTFYEQTYGQNVTMQCSITATPDISEVRWQRFVNGAYQDIFTQSSTKYYGSSVTNFALTITNLVFTDAGEYRCTATNQVGRGVSPNRATLSVLGAKPSVIAPQNSYSAVIGTNVSLACVISVTSTDPPVLRVVWKKMTPSGSGTIDVSGSQKYGGSTMASPDLVIANLDVHDNGNYSCLATNAAGTSESGTIILIVTGSRPTPFIPLASYSVLIGNDIQIPCSVSANPAATSIQWQFTSNSGSSAPITQSTTKYTLVGDDTTTSNLTINSAALTDAGTYRCSATNIVGTGSDSATLTITGITPNVTIPDTSLSVQKRQNITIACEVTDALPKETSILWEFRANQGDSGTIISVDGNPTKYQGGTVAVPSLTILSVAASDEGYYTCIASNVFGEGRSEQAFLEATGNAATVTVSPPSQSVLQKSTAIIQCIINNANPGVTEVSWEKVSSGTTSAVLVTGRFNGSTPSLPNLIISDLQPSDAGTYYCSARNAIGTSRSNTGSNLIVTGAVPNNVQILGATSQTVNLGGSLTLQCSGQGTPAPTLTWIFSSGTSGATQVGTGTTYSITNAQRTDGGTYVCRGTNSLGSTDSQGVTVDVQFAPIDARTGAQKSLSAAVGSQVTMVCNVDANPSASYEWYRSNQQVSTQMEYTFTLSSLALLGSYTCRATNSRGSIELRYTLSQAVGGNTGASTASTGLSTGEIAAIILAVLLLLILIIIIIICCLTHGACGVICGKKQEVKGRVEPEKEVYKETQKEVIIPRFHEESIKGKRQPSAVSRKDVDIRVQNGGLRRENDYEIVRYETVPAPPISTQYITESPRPHHLPALSYTYEDVEKKRKKRRKKKKHHHRRHRDEAEEVDYPPSPSRRRHGGYYDDERIIETRRSTRSPQRYRRESDEEMIIERRSPSTKRRYEENYITEERYSSGDVVQDNGDLRAYNGVVYREAPSRHSGGHYRGRDSRTHSGRRERGSDDDVEVVYGKEYVVER